MNAKNPFILLAATAVLAVGIATVSLAQVPGGGGPSPGGGPGAGGTGVPIDGGASLLLAGGVAYAMRRLRARRKKA